MSNLTFDGEIIDGYVVKITVKQDNIDKPLLMDEEVTLIVSGVVKDVKMHVDGRSGNLMRVHEVAINKIEVE